MTRCKERKHCNCEGQQGNEDAYPTKISISDKFAKNVTDSSYTDSNALCIICSCKEEKLPSYEDPRRNLVQLCSLLSLDKMKSCEINIIYGSHKNPKELEQEFLFLLICDDDEFKGKDQRHKLWEQITQNVHEWVELLPSQKRNQLNLSENFSNKLFSRQCYLTFLEDKEFKSALPIILVSKNILQYQNNGFSTSLSKNLNKSKFYLSLNNLKEYFVFDSEDYDKGFIKTVGEQIPNTALINGSENLDYISSILSKSVKNNPVIERIEENYNKQDALLNSRNTHMSVTKPTQIAPKKSKQTEIQVPRDFKQISSNVTYVAGKIFLQPENDGTLSYRCIEFKSFFTCEKKKIKRNPTKFLQEVIRFACGCLNLRRNGTIYFGIADSVRIDDKENYKHGEVVGFEILSEDGQDLRTIYTDALRDGIKKCFISDVVSAALKCISNPIFVPVVTPETDSVRFVMEVDIEPSSNICENLNFKVNLSKIPNIISKSLEDRYILYLRNGASTEKLKDVTIEQLFIKSELPVNVKIRKDFEQEKKCKCDLFNTCGFFLLWVVYVFLVFFTSDIC